METLKKALEIDTRGRKPHRAADFAPLRPWRG